MKDFWRNLSQEERDKCLREAFKRKSAPLAKLVLEAGKISKVEAQRHLHESITRMNDTELFNLLLDAGAEAGEWELRSASEVGNEEIVDILIELGMKAFSQSICIASLRGHNNILKKMLDAGGKPDARNSFPINASAKAGIDEVVKTLLAYGEKATNVRPDVIAHLKKMANHTPGYSKYSKTLAALKAAGANID